MNQKSGLGLFLGLVLLVSLIAFVSVSVAGASSEDAHLRSSSIRNLDLQGEPISVTLTVNIDPVGGGTVGKLPAGPQYLTNQVVTLTAQPNVGWQFSGWSGSGLSGATPSTTITMNANKTVTATFAQLTCYTLNVSNPNGTVTRNPLPNCNSGTQYFSGTTVTLTALPNSGYTFGNWSVDASGTANPTTVIMTGTKNVTANFTACYTLNVSNPNGTVTRNPLPNCNSGTQYSSGTTVTLTALPNSGYTFGNWSVDASGTANPTTVIMTGTKSVTANFTQIAGTTPSPAPTQTSQPSQPAATITPLIPGGVVPATITPTTPTALPSTGDSSLVLLAVGVFLALILFGARTLRQNSL